MVTNSADRGSGSLRTVIANASAGDTIEFNMSSGHVTSPITLTSGQITISKNLTIVGPGASLLTISGNQNSAIFAISSGSKVSISDLAMTDCVGGVGGAIANNGGNLKLVDDSLSGNLATDSGGAIYNGSGSLSMSGCSVSGNQAQSGHAGGLFVGGGVVTIENSTLEGNHTPYDGGAIAVEGGSLKLINSTLASNTANRDGGGLVVSNGTASLVNSTLASNTALRYGGGLRNNATASLFNCTVADNTGSLGGGARNSGTITMGNTIVAGNDDTSAGPDYYGSVTTDSGNNLVGNTSGASGFTQSSDLLNVNPMLGSLGNYGGPTETIPLDPGSPAIDAGNNAIVPTGITTDQRGFTRFANGTTDIGAFEVQDYVVTNTNDSGGGSLRSALSSPGIAGGATIVIATSGTISLLSSLPEIRTNLDVVGPGANDLSVSGGGSYQGFVIDSGSVVSISGLTITDSMTISTGGGVYNNGTLTLTDCAITQNSTADDGGGIDNEAGATLTLIGCTVSGNSSGNDGGGIENAGTLTLVSSTIADNAAPAGQGGGINDAGVLTIINSTIAGNTAYNGGGILEGGTASLANAIVAENTLDGGSGPDFRGSVTTDQGHNLIGNNTGATGLTQSSDLVNVNPLLSSLGSYGGTTQTMPLLPGSPAIDAGSNALATYDSTALSTDQRGYTRIVNGTVDIGADECQGFSIAVASGNNQSTAAGTDFASSLEVVVTSSIGEPVAGGVVTFSAPGSGASATFPSGSTATIGAGGLASLTAAANGTTGNYSVTVSASGAAATATFSLTDSGGVATKLAFLNGPATTVYGNTINGGSYVTVEVLDQNNNVVTGSTVSITIALDNDPTGAVLDGTLTVNAASGIATFSTLTITKVGTGYTLEATSSGLTATPASSSFNITQRALTITAVANTKTYDRTTSASATPTITSGTLASGDTADFSEAYSGHNAGSGLTLAPSGTVNDGNGGNNYTYTFDPVSTGVINVEALTITAVANTKTYDGGTSAAAVPTITSGSLQGSDTADFSEAYGSHNAGSGLTLTPSGSVGDGNSGDNYSYNFVPASTGVITPEALTITAAANTKTYDGGTSAAAVPTITSGSLQGADTADFSEVYSSHNAGTGLWLTPSGSVADGNGGANYTYTFVPASTGVITAEALTITAVANTKTYDATTGASATPTITSGTLASGDTTDFTEAYSSRNVGTGLTLTPSGSVEDGNGGNNYTYTFDPVSTGVINAAALTITATANTKVYDGGTSAAAVPTITSGNLQGSDTADFSEAYGSHNAGSGLTLTPSGSVDDGDDGDDYTYTFVPVSTGVISARALTITAVANIKVYDATTGAAIVPVITSGSLQGSDTADFSEAYSSRNAGIGLTLTVSGSVEDGDGGDDYTYTFVPVSTGVITPEALTITAVANTKVYDGSTSAAAVPTITTGNLQGSDTADFSEAYSGRNAGTGLTLMPSGSVADGDGGDDYTYTFVPVSTGVITAEALTITAVANTKGYDATTGAAAVPVITSGSLRGSDAADFSEAYSSRDAGTGMTLTPSGTVADGNGGDNYSYTFVPVTTGVITAEALTITAVPNTKVYDATSSAAAAPVITTGSLRGSDTADFSEAYVSRNAGTGLTLTVSGSVEDGDGGDDYTYTFVPVSTGVITPEALTITAVANTKVYDGSTSAAAVPTITTGSLQGSDTEDFIETYNTRNVGTGEVLTPSGTVSDGNEGNNYLYTFVPDSAGVITRAALTIGAVTNTKQYDGTASAAAIPGVSGLHGTDTVTNLSENYSTPAIGTGKTLTVATYTVNDGNGGNNYTVTTVANDAGVILPPTPTQLVFQAQPSTTATAGQVFPTQPVIYVLDQNGNLDTTDNTTVVTVSILAGSGPLLGTTSVTVFRGVATFTNLQDSNAGTLVLLFTTPNLTGAQSNAITVNPPPPPPSSHTPPQIVQLHTTGGHGTAHTIVLHLNEAISSKPVLPLSAFSLEAPDADGIFDRPVRITRAAYNSGTHKISLFVSRRTTVHGTVQVTVSAGAIVNRYGQPLAGVGTSGAAFVSFVDLP
jgi:hypothetical protein